MSTDVKAKSYLTEIQPLSQVFDYPLKIRESHLDTFGHINNAVYLEIYEEARWELLTGRGYGMKDVIKTGHGPTILEINIKFLREVRNREDVVIKTFVTGMDGKISRVRQVMMNSRGEEASMADFTFGLFDLKARKLVEPTEAWKNALGLLPR